MRFKEGIVTSAKMEKTVVVTVVGYKTHPKYKKKYRVSKKYLAHDEQKAAKEGDRVTITETRPMSKLKRWRIVTPDEVAKMQANRPAVVMNETGEAEMLIAEFEPRKRAKTRGDRLQENAAPAPEPAGTGPVPEPTPAAAPAPAPEAPAATPAPETPTVETPNT